MPLKFKLLNSINPRNSTNAINLRARYLLPGGIASVVAIADEIHQAYVPGRDASITDVLLDIVGISLVLFFFFRVLKTKTSLIH
jgi:VanZ family protein